MLGWSLSCVVVVSLVAVGLGAVVAPRRSSVQYGLVLDDPRALAFVRAMGIRDVVIGGLLGLMTLARMRQALGWSMCFTALIALTDLLVVSADRRAVTAPAQPGMDAARVLHAGGVVGLVLTGMALLLSY